MKKCPNCRSVLSPDGSCPSCGYDAAAGPAARSTSGRSRAGRIRSSQDRDAGPRGGVADRTASLQVAERNDRAVRGLFTWQRGPLVLGIVAVLVAVGVVVARGNAGAARPVAVVQAASSSAQVMTKRKSPKTSGAATAVKTKSRSAKPRPVVQAKTGAKKEAADSDGLQERASEIAAKYENSPQYQIPVGASPVDVRASHPINLYIPPHDPMYNIVGHIAYPPIGNETRFIRWMVAHTPQKNTAFLREKWNLVREAIANHYLTHKRVLEAFLLTPREWFVRRYNLPNSYENTSLPIGYGQTITDPELVIHMTDALDPQPNQKVLEIGTGSGYQSAFLSELSNYVYTVEIVRPLGEETNQLYLLHTPQMPQYANIHRRLADGYYGWSKYAPFDRIIVTTGIDHIPPDLLKELKPGGIMLIPVGPPTSQTVLKVTKTVGPNGHVHLKRKDIFHGFRKEMFVPFTAAGGGTHNTGSSGAAR